MRDNKGMKGGNPDALRSSFRGLNFRGLGFCGLGFGGHGTSATGKPMDMAFIAKDRPSRSFDTRVDPQAIRSQPPGKRKATRLPVCVHARRAAHQSRTVEPNGAPEAAPPAPNAAVARAARRGDMP